MSLTFKSINEPENRAVRSAVFNAFTMSDMREVARVWKLTIRNVIDLHDELWERRIDLLREPNSRGLPKHAPFR